MPELALIAALDRHHAIGRGNALPWHLPDDLKRFKRLTMGGTLLMGRRTAEAIGRALPGRTNLVLTRSGKSPLPGMEAVATLDEALKRCTGDTLWVIGGEQVYFLTLPRAKRLYLTWVDTEVKGADAHFPEFVAERFEAIHEQHHPADARHPWPMRFIDYRRRS
jgi:dihydrofolate reductase